MVESESLGRSILIWSLILDNYDRFYIDEVHMLSRKTLIVASRRPSSNSLLIKMQEQENMQKARKKFGEIAL